MLASKVPSTLVTAVVTMLAAAGLAGCGGSQDFAKQSAAQIQAAALKDMRTLSSVRVAGQFQSGGGDVKVDLSIGNDTCTGEMTLGGADVQLLRVDGKDYLKADAAFWEQFSGAPKPAVQQLVRATQGKWVTGMGGADFASFCDIDELLKQLDDDKSDSQPRKGDVAEVAGQQAVEIIVQDTQGNDASAWVATEGKHYLLKFESTEGKEPGEATFSDFNADLDVQAPSDDEVVDLQELASAFG